MVYLYSIRYIFKGFLNAFELENTKDNRGTVSIAKSQVWKCHFSMASLMCAHILICISSFLSSLFVVCLMTVLDSPLW